MSVNEKLRKLASKSTGDWLAETEKEMENKGARVNARKVALHVLRVLRERQISQTELAAKMGVSRQQVAKIVKGNENFTFETIDKLERALNIKLMTISLFAAEYPVQAPALSIKLYSGLLSAATEYRSDRRIVEMRDAAAFEVSNAARLFRTVTILRSWQKRESHEPVWSIAVAGSNQLSTSMRPVSFDKSKMDIVIAPCTWSIRSRPTMQEQSLLIADPAVYSMS